MASTASSAKKPIIAALLFIRSALSTKPYFAGGTSGSLGGAVTPCGSLDAAARTARTREGLALTALLLLIANLLLDVKLEAQALLHDARIVAIGADG